MKKVRKIAGIVSVSVLILTGCTEKEPISEEVNVTIAEETTEPEIDTAEEKESDIYTELAETEEQAEALEKKLVEDASLSQGEMNEITYEIYMLWDDALNALWQDLWETMDEDAMQTLLEEQRNWIDEKEKVVQQIGEQAGGGSVASLISNKKAAEITKERVYELAEYMR